MVEECARERGVRGVEGDRLMLDLAGVSRAYVIYYMHIYPRIAEEDNFIGKKSKKERGGCNGHQIVRSTMTNQQSCAPGPGLR